VYRNLRVLFGFYSVILIIALTRGIAVCDFVGFVIRIRFQITFPLRLNWRHSSQVGSECEEISCLAGNQVQQLSVLDLDLGDRNKLLPTFLSICPCHQDELK
jgi:hypothetical protein